MDFSIQSMSVEPPRKRSLSREVTLYLDSRETGKGVLTELFGENDLSVEPIQLPVGDMLWVYKYPHIRDNTDENILGVIIERKTISDLVASTMDKRLHEQKERLTSSTIPTIIYLIEGVTFSGVKLDPSALRKIITDIQIYNKILILRTRGIDHTINLCKEIHNRLKQNVYCKPEIIGITYENFKAVTKKKQANRVGQIFSHMLKQIKRVSPGSASAIAEYVGTFSCLMQRFKPDRKRFSKEIANLNVLTGAKLRLGDQLAYNVEEFFTEEF